MKPGIGKRPNWSGRGPSARGWGPWSRAPLLLPGWTLILAAFSGAPSPVSAQDNLRERLDALSVPELRFDPPEPQAAEVDGVPLYFLEDRDLPLVTVHVSFRGGYARLPRSYLGAATALPSLLRTSGTRALSPDSVDARVEFYAMSLSFGQAGSGLASTLNVLTENLAPAVEVWRQMIQAPAFDSAQVEVWRGRELERVLRRRDDLASMAYSRFNQIMFGDHPVGWELGSDDLDPEDLSAGTLRAVHEAIVCPDNLVLGIVGDLDWPQARQLARGLTRGLPPCSGLLTDEPAPDLRTDPGVFVIHREASRRIRTREGLAYGASSLWTVSPRRDGLLGAITRTKPETAVEAARLILAEMDSMAVAPPTDDELRLAIDEIVNGFVFNFETPFQIVSRAIALRHQDLPEDWLERYLDGVQAVTGSSVHETFRTHLDTGRMTLLLVGDTTRFSRSPGELGIVTVLPDLPSSQRGSRRSPR